MSEHFDDLETRDPEERERRLFAALGEQIANAKAKAPAYADSLADVEPHAVTDRAALARLPIVRKAELMERQKSGPDDRRPFGGLTRSSACDVGGGWCESVVSYLSGCVHG